MKKAFLPALAALFICGCASSERAFRMSGGVLDSYSAPKSYRTRSEKFQKMDKMSIPHRANKTEVAGINDDLVNIWPFYFRNKNYFSVLWPMIDWDTYGMAIRPFYNQEGDDYSILFPVSAWNIADKSGWVANFRWTKTGFGFLPLTYQNRTEEEFWCYYTPLFIANRDYTKLGYDYKKHFLRRSNGDFTEFMLGFYGENRFLDTKDWDALFWWRNDYNDDIQYKLWKSGRNPIKNPQELTALRKEVEKSFVQYKETYGGFFPLFYLSRTPYHNRYHWNILGLLADVEKSGSNIDVSIFGKWGFSYEYHERDLDEAVVGYKDEKSSTKFFSIFLLSGGEEATCIKADAVVKKLTRLSSTPSGNFAKDLPKVNAILQELDPNAKVPEFINNDNLLRFYVDDFVNEYCKKHKFEFYTTGKFLSPFYAYEWDLSKREWVIPLLLSGGEKHFNGDWMWLSLPLLSGAGHNAKEDYFYVLPPLAYMNSTERFETIGKYIHASDAKWSRYKRDNVETTDIYAACGLFYRGRVKFLVAKPGLSSKTLNTLVNSFYALHRKKRFLNDQEKQYEHDLKLTNAIKERNKIEYYEKMIELEKLKLRRKEIDKDWKSFNKEIAKARKNAEKVNFKFEVSDWANKKQIDKVTADLYAQTTAVREKSDIGNGFFFRKENFYNGDWKWRLFLNIAGGEKDGDRESSHVLHFLYRKRTDGQRMEKLIFPFISIQQDGNNSKVSFLGRIYQKSVIDGKTSGYIFFIPFGK